MKILALRWKSPGAAAGAAVFLLLSPPLLHAAEPSTAAASAGEKTWLVVGRQGILQHVVVPMAEAGDRAAYERQAELICGEAETCFVNFYTNSTGAVPAIPLPDAIAAQPTAVLRRSAKQGTEGFRWSCRLKLPEPCF